MTEPRTAETKRPEYVIGIDFGQNGAIWGYLLNADDFLDDSKNQKPTDFCIDLPTFDVKEGKSIKKRVNFIRVAQVLEELHIKYKIIAVGCEKLHPISGKNPAAMGVAKLCVTAARILGHLDYMSLKFGTLIIEHDVRTWKKHYFRSASAPKDESRREATKRRPKYAHLFERGKDNNRSDAFLLSDFTVYVLHRIDPGKNGTWRT